jgi:mercuric ion transport protein
MAQDDSRLVKVGLIGAVVAALCCFTPVLVVLLGAVGLGALTGYLDYVLLPALFVFGGVLAYALWRRRQRRLTEEKS